MKVQNNHPKTAESLLILGKVFYPSIHKKFKVRFFKEHTLAKSNSLVNFHGLPPLNPCKFIRLLDLVSTYICS